MILNLESKKNISLLIAKGPIGKKDVTILFAGIKKLFRDGKNRMVLELPDVSAMSTEDLRELVKLNLLAAELSGEIVLASINEANRLRINGLSSPPFIKCFLSRAEALDYFAPPAVEKGEELQPSKTAPTKPGTASASAPAPTKDEFRHKEIHELAPLRKEIERLRLENVSLADQLKNALFSFRDPKAEAQWKKKVEYLEDTLAKLLQKSP